MSHRIGLGFWYYYMISYWNNKIHQISRALQLSFTELMDRLLPLTCTFTPCSRKSQMQATRTAEYSTSAVASLVCFASSLTVCNLKARGISCSRSVWLQGDPDPRVLPFGSARVLMHYHTNKNESGPRAWLSKGQKGCTGHGTENPQVSCRQKVQLNKYQVTV